MKHHTHTSSRCILRAINAPYRQALQYERDPVPVHRQSFPKPGEPHACLSSVVSRRGLDPFPIHRQSFEEMLPSLTQCLQEQALSHRRRFGNTKLLSVRSPEDFMSFDLQSHPPSMSPDVSECQSSQICDPNNTPIHSQTLDSPGLNACGPSPTSVSRSLSPRVIPDELAYAAQESSEPHSPALQIEYRLIPGAGSSTPTDDATLSHPQTSTSQYSACRVEHKIRGLDQVMHWFYSRGCEPLLTPPPYESLEYVDMECSAGLGGGSREPGSSSPPNASPLVWRNWGTLLGHSKDNKHLQVTPEGFSLQNLMCDIRVAA
ncbi:hypothetical protein DFJ58DRAFT_736921 [Suillus subalutaceus]|uniref:uncharacterized protein n=1 Tax=Suillus subalutaceus TaxID=48586 RepID=UPI001B87C52C|nr:uncharacterized protein DFJ58DRAFT_736921 [Suillus subalutaceus]KAG1830673.1 hypothetical protein DFJ58DRAFT_736921 [Suillus subalutaceus]